VHGENEFQMAINASELLFGKNPTEALAKIDERTFLSVFDGVPKVSISKSKMANSETISDLLSIDTDGTIFSSKGEARRMIQGGGVSINKEKIMDPNHIVDFLLIQNKYLLIQKGKKNYYLIEILNTL
jgi:tyrosyl-tRNA synthetase